MFAKTQPPGSAGATPVPAGPGVAPMFQPVEFAYDMISPHLPYYVMPQLSYVILSSMLCVSRISLHGLHCMFGSSLSLMLHI
jgi:hypothetical protein